MPRSDRLHQFLTQIKVIDLERGLRNLTSLAEKLGETLQNWLAQWQPHLARSPDPDMALNNLERFLGAEGALPLVQELLAEHPDSLETLIGILATSQFLSDTLVTQPGAVAMLGIPLRRTPTKAELIAELKTQIDSTFEDSAVLRVIRQYRARHLLRIGTNDIIRDRSLEEVTEDISRVAEAAVDVTLQTALRSIGKRFGEPLASDGSPGRMVVLAFGKLGGYELNYSSDIDLMIVFEQEGKTAGNLEVTLEEFYSRVTTEMLRLLTAAPAAYRVDFRLRPEGKRGSLVRSLASTLAYYDSLGRTWERQALIKLRPIAGDLELGKQFLAAIEPFVYRKFLGFGEIQEIKAIKRKIEQRSNQEGVSLTDVKTGYGGIRDVEFIIQFLQLLNGGDLPQVRHRNTLHAIQALSQAGCLSNMEGQILENTYRFLRKTEHRLQLLSDLQTHTLPSGPDELRRLALRLGYRDQSRRAEEQFRHDFEEMTAYNRQILNHLLHDAFSDRQEHTDPEADLILLPEIDLETAQSVLSRYRFQDVPAALENLRQLAQETVPFLPAHRCRHFLASIAPELLRSLAETPNPDMALINLEKVTASLGAKGVLWELFNLNPPTLRLYVELCAWSPFLSQILTSHPGMIDELLDSLVLNQPRSLSELRQELAELCKGADPQLIERILHRFQNKELLRIGVCDILGKTPLQETLAGLSDLAEALLGRIVDDQFKMLCRHWGMPSLGEQGKLCRFVLLGLGKFGGREMSYQSDLDLVLVYEADGQTNSAAADLALITEPTANFHFFSELAQQVIKALGLHGPLGRLYQVDMRLRPTGKSGSLVVPLQGFQKYYAQGHGQVWERQALTRARVVYGDAQFGLSVMAAVHEAAYAPVWQPSTSVEIVTMRKRLEESRDVRDIKRGTGGIVDVEFLVQLLLLKYAGVDSSLREPNIWRALDALMKRQLLSPAEYGTCIEHYEYLRKIESRLRIVHNQSQDRLPEAQEELARLARRMGFHHSAPDQAAAMFLIDLDRRTGRMRALFQAVANREQEGSRKTNNDQGPEQAP